MISDYGETVGSNYPGRRMREGRSWIGFWRDRAATIAPIFALSLFVLVGTVGLSVDGARVYHAQQKIQAVADAAVLAAARRALMDGSTEQVEETFAKFVEMSGIMAEFGLRPVSPDLSQPRRISAAFVADVPTLIMPVLGFSTVEIHAFSSAEFGFTKVEVALALDNTGSMAGAKMEALKTAANRMVDTLLDKAPEDGAIRISLVPFGQYVNVGLHNRHAAWLDVRDDYTEPAEWCGEVAPLISSTNCRTVTYSYYEDGRPMTGSYQQCDNVYGAPVYQCSTWTNTYAWYGCVGSRNHPLNMRDADYSTRIPGILNAACPSPIQPLTSSRSELHTAIDGMIATGETYVPSGVMWGWRVLTPDEPFNESAGDRTDADGNRLSKVLVLMTDGENTKSPSYPNHDGSDATLANQLTAEACTAAKSARIQIFAIAFSVTSEPIKTLLRGCVSRAGNFYDAADAGQLDAAMQAIASQIGGLRLTN